ncbi:MAG: MotA/TolQ/ExbB proton channel family protein [Algicola sp.]|nr:MotA/TolQ/ExbB proton channel family protein [Algicola sp.]
MDKGSSIGLVVLLVAVIGGILSTGAPMISFFDVPSVFIVIIGTFGAVMISYRLPVFIVALLNISLAFRAQTTHPLETVEQLVDLADISRSGGFLAMEGVKLSDPFMAKAKDLLIDGHDIETLEAILTKEIFLTKERNNSSVKVLNSFTEIAPAMGMVGTLIGLVAMLLSMEDPKTIGKSMSVALLTTLYGALIANGITGPLARKLSERSSEIKQHQSMVRDGFVRIANGDNPKAIHEYLQSYLEETKRRPPLSASELQSQRASSIDAKTE